MSQGESSLSGRIYDSSDRQPIPYAAIFDQKSAEMYFSDTYGKFVLPCAAEGRHWQIRMLGYEDQVFSSFNCNQDTIIYLRPVLMLLPTILIAEDHAKHEHYLSAVHVNERFFKQNQETTLATALQRIPGINAMVTGAGIGKPIIRGMYGNRIVVNKDYIKQEGHQWGNDHGLEIDPFDVQRVEIIKGPGALLYGSDALGGVINILPEALPKDNTTELHIRPLYRSNNQLLAGSMAIRTAFKNWFFSARMSGQSYGDFRIPADEFVYNGFELPLTGRKAKNTAGREQSYRISAGYKTNQSISRLSYAVFGLQGGIFSGAIGIPRFYTLADDGNSRNIELPSQAVTHQRLTWNHIQFTEKGGHWAINAGYQHNLRREFSFQEAHSRIEGSDNQEQIALQFELKSYSFDIHRDLKLNNKLRLVAGLQSQIQKNTRDGFDFLIPDFSLWRAGAFSLLEYKPNNKRSLTGGFRYDLANNSSTEFFAKRLDRNNREILRVDIPALQRRFQNWAASFGIQQLINKQWRTRMHLGKTFRIPYPNELVSEGMHHGFFRYEKGNRDLRSEKGYQLDLGADFDQGRISFSASAFFNFFDNYIYLRPTPNFAPLPESGLIFEYIQHNTIFSGLEFEYTWNIHKGLYWSQTFDYVYSHNINTGLALPFTPPANLRSEIQYRHSAGVLHFQLSFTQQLISNAGPNMVDRNERTTPGSSLYHLSCAIEHQKWAGTSFQFGIQNIFDRPFLNHLSRYRLIDLPEPGRNIQLSAFIPIKWNHRTSLSQNKK
jgi:iron complex outermembrane receptor protein